MNKSILTPVALLAFGLAGCGGGGSLVTGGNTGLIPVNPVTTPTTPPVTAIVGHWIGTNTDTSTPTLNNSGNVETGNTDITFDSTGTGNGTFHNTANGGVSNSETGGIDGNGHMNMVMRYTTASPESNIGYTWIGTLTVQSNGHLVGDITEELGGYVHNSAHIDWVKQ